MPDQTQSYEADNQTGVNHEGELANTPVERLTAGSIVSDNVENDKGERLGTIHDLMINVNTGMIEYAVISFGAVLGIGGKLFAVPFKELRLAPEKRVFLLDRGKEFLEKMPGFDKHHWPGANDHYYDDVNLYWRLSPDAYFP